jgi:protein-disulfide isomerase
MKNTPHRTLFLVTLLIIIAVIVAVVFHTPKEKETFKEGFSIPTQNQPMLGNPKAPLHIVAFEDLKCIACRYFTTNMLPEIKEKLINTGRVKYTVILLAFIQGSPPAANAAYCLNEQSSNYYFQFLEYIYHHQPNEALDWATKKNLLEFASHVPGANMSELASCIDNKTYYAKINSNLQLARTLSTDGSVKTPSLYLNGVPMHLDPNTIKDLTKQSEKTA